MSNIHNGFARGYMAVQNLLAKTAEEMSSEDIGSLVGAGTGLAAGAGGSLGAMHLYSNKITPLLRQMMTAAGKDALRGPESYPGSDLKSRVRQALANMKHKASTFAVHHPTAVRRGALAIPALLAGTAAAAGGSALGGYLGNKFGNGAE